MSHPIRTTLAGRPSSINLIGAGFVLVSFGLVGLVLLVFGVAGLGNLASIVSLGLGLSIAMDVIREHLRGRRAAARVSAVSAPTSLRLVRGLLPGDERTAWWAEVNSCLAETVDPGERRQYVRNYRREVPQLIWTSWSEHLSASDRRELS